MEVKDLKVGDRCLRQMGNEGLVTMEMQVTKVSDGIITCAAVHKNEDGSETLAPFGWTFDQTTGAEEDEDLGWGVRFGVTGTVLKLKTEKPS